MKPQGCFKCSANEGVSLYVVRTGPQQSELSCVDHIPEAELKRYPLWRDSLELSRKRSEQARRNFNHGRTN
jgi:hypothetical protein